MPAASARRRTVLLSGTALGLAVVVGGCEARASKAPAADPDTERAVADETPDDPDPGEVVGGGDAAPSRPLEEALLAKREEFTARAPEETITLYQQGIDDVAGSGVLDRALGVGDAAPDFVLPDAMEQPVRLATLLESGPVVLTWYRGGWCPYCNIALRAMQERLPDLDALGATLVALSPERPDMSLDTVEKSQLEFVVLTDEGNAVADDYGVRYRLPGAILESYNAAFDMHGHNGETSGTLPLAATYVIDTDGVIRWAFVSADYRERAEPADVIEAVRALSH